MPDWQPRNTARARTLRNQPTPAEQKLWQYLSNSQLDGHKFSRQMPIGPYFCDFLCRRHRLVIELDGASHAVTVETDQRRDAFMRDQGYSILRFGNADVMGNVEGVVTVIAAALADRPTPSPSRTREGSSG